MISIISCVLVFVTYLLISRVRHYSLLARCGIPGPKPNLIIGNLLEYNKLQIIQRQNEWIKMYGKIVGYYFGRRPIVLVADPDLTKNIQIKDFQYFADRPHSSLKYGLMPNPANEGALVNARGQRWRELRSTLTPTFSGSKLKTLTPIIDDSINILIEKIEKCAQKDEEFDIYDMFQNLTTDVIGRTAFGIQSNVQNDSNNKFLKAAKEIFNISLNQWVFLFIICFPITDKVLYPLRRLQQIILEKRGLSPNGILLDMARDIIQLRKQNPNIKRKDLLQLMLDTKILGEEMSAMSVEYLTAGTEECEEQNGSPKTAGKGNKNFVSLTDDEIKANCVLFFEAGYETTSTALAFIAHILVNYPDVQEKIREEVRELYESEGKLDFNTVSKLKYMERVINETMRIYPPVSTSVYREVLKDYKYKDIIIPKGAVILFAIHYLHHDPDYWTEPDKFDPERFSAERKHAIHSSSWQPFGNGPRNCIGMRFALFEIKLLLAKLLLKYRLEPSSKTEIGDIETHCKVFTLTPKNGVFVKAVKL